MYKNKLIDPDKNSFICDICNLCYKHKTNWYTHIKKCKYKQENENSEQNNIPQNNIPQNNIPQNNIPQNNIPQNNIPQNIINNNIPNNNPIGELDLLKKEIETLRREKEEIIKEQLKEQLKDKTEQLQEKNEQLKEKDELIKSLMNGANTIINKAQDNTKIVAQSALKYANEKFSNAPVLKPIENFNINDLDCDTNKEELIDLLVYNAKHKTLDKLLGDHIIKNYKTDNPQDQSFHTTDCSRLNYIVRELMKDETIWSIDKNGNKICSSIVKPLINNCMEMLLEYQKQCINELLIGKLEKQFEIHLIMKISSPLDLVTLEENINKYIAPIFNLNKN